MRPSHARCRQWRYIEHSIKNDQTSPELSSIDVTHHSAGHTNRRSEGVSDPNSSVVTTVAPAPSPRRRMTANNPSLRESPCHRRVQKSNGGSVGASIAEADGTPRSRDESRQTIGGNLLALELQQGGFRAETKFAVVRWRENPASPSATCKLAYTPAWSPFVQDTPEEGRDVAPFHRLMGSLSAEQSAAPAEKGGRRRSSERLAGVADRFATDVTAERCPGRSRRHRCRLAGRGRVGRRKTRGTRAIDPNHKPGVFDGAPPRVEELRSGWKVTVPAGVEDYATRRAGAARGAVAHRKPIHFLNGVRSSSASCSIAAAGSERINKTHATARNSAARMPSSIMFCTQRDASWAQLPRHTGRPDGTEPKPDGSHPRAFGLHCLRRRQETPRQTHHDLSVPNLLTAHDNPQGHCADNSIWLPADALVRAFTRTNHQPEPTALMPLRASPELRSALTDVPMTPPRCPVRRSYTTNTMLRLRLREPQLRGRYRPSSAEVRLAAGWIAL